MLSNRRTRQSASYLEQKRKKITWAIVIGIVIIVLAILGLSWLTRISMLKIDTVRIDGADQDITSTLQKAAESAISGTYFGLFSKSNAILYPRGAVARAVKEASGRIETVETHLNDLHQISITVTEKAPSAIVCPDFPNLDNTTSSAGNCYFVDKTGYVYAQSPDVSGNIYHRYYVPTANSTSSTGMIGIYATSSDEFVLLQSFYNQTEDAGLTVESMLIKEKGEYEMYILNPDKSIAIVYFNEGRPLKDELSNLLSFWSYMVSGSGATKPSPSFDYIDVRYGTNIFYRINGGVVSSK